MIRNIVAGFAGIILLALPACSQSPDYSNASSRRVLVVNGGLYTNASSRRLLVTNGGLYTNASSRRLLVLLPTWSTGDARKALSIAAGLLTGTPALLSRLDVVTDGDSAGKVDVRDAVRLLRRSVGLDP